MITIPHFFSPSRGGFPYYDRRLEFTHPCFTHNSDEVTFTTTLRKVGVPYRSIMSASIEKNTLHLLVDQAIHGYWSHSGRYLSFTSVETNTLSILDTETGTARTIAMDELHGFKCFTPDDRYIINTMNTEDGKRRLFRIPIEGGEPEQLTFCYGSHFAPDCSPDGKWIMYTETGIPPSLYLYNTNTKISSPVFSNSRDMDNFCVSGSFSPDGSKFCYIRKIVTNCEVFVADFTGDGKLQTNGMNYGTRLTFTGGKKGYTDWSPDGKWIAYLQGEFIGSGGDIWIVSSEGGDPINLTGSLQTNRIMAGYAVINVSIESLNRAIAHGNRIAILITLIMIGIGVTVTILLIRNIVNPIKYLADATGKVAQGDFNQKVNIKKRDEIGT